MTHNVKYCLLVRFVFPENYNYYFKCSISSIFVENFSHVTLKFLIFNEGHTTGFSNTLDEVLGDQLVWHSLI